MQCKIFYDTPYVAGEKFNAWAKGKMLTKDVIIHTIPFPSGQPGTIDFMAIVVYHPEHPYWDKIKE